MFIFYVYVISFYYWWIILTLEYNLIFFDDFDICKVDIDCHCITENGIEEKSFQIELKELNECLKKIGSEYRYEDMKEDFDEGKDCSIKLADPIFTCDIRISKD